MISKFTLFALPLVLIWSVTANAYRDDTQYDFLGGAHAKKYNGDETFTKGDFANLTSDGLSIRLAGGSCHFHVPQFVDNGGGRFFSDVIDSFGGAAQFNNLLKAKFGFERVDLKKKLTLESPLPASKICNHIAANFVFKVTDNDLILVIEDDGIYRFARRQESQKEVEERTGSYRIAALPITDLDVDCEEKVRNDAKFPMYDDTPLHLKEKDAPSVEHFNQLPSIGDIEVYLGTYFEEHEKEDNGRVVGNGGELFTYLVTLKGDKVNYVRLGNKYTIGKDYGVIKTLKDGKLIKYAIKQNGVIIKVE